MSRLSPETLERPSHYPVTTDTRNMQQLITTYAESARYVSSPIGLRNFRSYKTLVNRAGQALVPLAVEIANGGDPVLSVPFESVQLKLGQEPISKDAATLEQKATVIGDWAEAESHIAIRDEAARIETGRALYDWLYRQALASMTDSDKEAIKHPAKYRASLTDWTKRSFMPRLVLPTGREISVLLEKTELGSKALIFGIEKSITITELLPHGDGSRLWVETVEPTMGDYFRNHAEFGASGTVDSSFAARDAILNKGKQLFGIR